LRDPRPAQLLARAILLLPFETACPNVQPVSRVLPMRRRGAWHLTTYLPKVRRQARPLCCGSLDLEPNTSLLHERPRIASLILEKMQDYLLHLKMRDSISQDARLPFKSAGRCE